MQFNRQSHQRLIHKKAAYSVLMHACTRAHVDCREKTKFAHLQCKLSMTVTKQAGLCMKGAHSVLVHAYASMGFKQDYGVP